MQLTLVSILSVCLCFFFLRCTRASHTGAFVAEKNSLKLILRSVETKQMLFFFFPATEYKKKKEKKTRNAVAINFWKIYMLLRRDSCGCGCGFSDWAILVCIQRSEFSRESSLSWFIKHKQSSSASCVMLNLLQINSYCGQYVSLKPITSSLEESLSPPFPLSRPSFLSRDFPGLLDHQELMWVLKKYSNNRST